MLAGLLFAAAGALAQSPVDIMVADLPEQLAQGSDASVSISLQLTDESAVDSEGVWFLNVVEPLGGGEVRQVSHLLFSAASENPGVFRRNFSTAELARGLEAVIEFRLRGGARPGDYLLALQLYSGPDTNPDRVSADNRLAMEFFPFSVVRAE